jgi:hypothetical protein
MSQSSFIILILILLLIFHSFSLSSAGTWIHIAVPPWTEQREELSSKHWTATSPAKSAEATWLMQPQWLSACILVSVSAAVIISTIFSFAFRVTVCKSCLVKHLEENNTCPSCQIVIHQSHPLQYISFDRTMQDIVYKLVPKLQESENLHFEVNAFPN